MTTIDADVFRWVVAHRFHAIDTAMWMVSAAGRGGFVWLVLGMLLAITRYVHPMVVVRLAAAVLVASLTANHVIKPIVHRTRPFDAVAGITVIGARPHDASFPSGHTANAFASAFELAQALPAAAMAWWGLACAIGFSRVYLGVHYPLDVIGGAAVGLACAALLNALVRTPDN
jgi:undecaprenyl-diphosphatase